MQQATPLPRQAAVPRDDGLTDDQLHERACWHSGAHAGALAPDGHVYSEPSEPGGLLGWPVIACERHRGKR